MVIAYSVKDIKTAYQLSPKMMMEVMMGKMENLKALDKSGVPWENMVAFIGHELPVKQDIIQEVHQRRAMCIQGSSRNYDRQYMQGEISKKELTEGYLNMLDKGVDIIEADLSIESGEAIKSLQHKNSSKQRFFKW
jgi:glycerophosphoryl diester phosphodiesterase